MSSPSSARKLTELFRGSQHVRTDEEASTTDTLQVPETATRRLSVRIPFLGRTRKKSTRSTHAPNDLPTTNERVPTRPKSLPDNGLRASAERSSVSLAHAPSVPSLGSKIAAHFTPTKPKVSISDVPPQRDSFSLHPPTPPIPRPASPAGSTRSRASQLSGATTPRPPSLAETAASDDYSDLFTRPINRKPHSSSKPTITSFSSPPNDEQTPTPTPTSIRHNFEPFPIAPKPESPTSFPSSRGLLPLTLVEKSRMRPPSFSAPFNLSPRKKHPEPSQPPSIPLPATPPSSRPPSVSSISRSSVNRKSLNLSVHSLKLPSAPRQRAHTMSPSNPPSPPPPLLTPSHSRTNSQKTSNDYRDKENLEIETASIEQLRQVLRSRNQALEDLTARFQKLAEVHLVEKSALEKKVSSLEREAARKDKEIKGLLWLVTNNRPNSSGNGTPLAPSGDGIPPTSDTATFSDGRSSIRSSLRVPQYRRLMGIHTDDSGAESYTSGGESVASGAESLTSLRGHRRTKRPSNLSRTTSTTLNGRSDLDIPIPTSKRSSMASTASSTSSYGQPATPTSLLSAIPETPLPVPLSKSFRDPAIAAAIQAAEQYREKEERQSASKSKSSSKRSDKQPAPTPAALYAANLKRGRPPSIAQVLDQSVTGMDKSRPAH